MEIQVVMFILDHFHWWRMNIMTDIDDIFQGETWLHASPVLVN